MKIKKVLREFVKGCSVYFDFIKEVLYFWNQTRKYNASTHTFKDREKTEYVLLRLNHTIEKGMSMRNPRKGFGQEKVDGLLDKLDRYYNSFFTENPDFLKYPLSTIKQYIEYTKDNGVDIQHIECKYNELLSKTGFAEVERNGGIHKVFKEDILTKCNIDFESLLLSRHSIRYFSKEKVDKELIDKALELAQRTPSACNRQGWKTYVFEGENSINLVKWQNGARGFENEMRNTILVTANLKAFLSYEVHQAYIDGGLYAMNLINALHSLGLGTMPLSCGFKCSKLKTLTVFGIPKNEVPILIIGFGKLEDSFNIADSSRKNISITNKFM